MCCSSRLEFDTSDHCIQLKLSWQYNHSTCGDEYTVEVLKASDYGVPQERERLIIRALKGASVPSMRVRTGTPAPSWYEAIADLIGDLPQCDLLPDQKKVVEALLDTRPLAKVVAGVLWGLDKGDR